MNDVLAILSQIRPEFDFASASDFFASGMLDSFDLTTLISALEERYGITLDGKDIVPENFRDVGAILQLLTRYDVTP